MKWILLVVYVFIAYTDFKYAKKVWKQGNKLAGGFIILTAATLIVLPVVAFIQ